jgi:hypothetical protein
MKKKKRIKKRKRKIPKRHMCVHVAHFRPIVGPISTIVANNCQKVADVKIPIKVIDANDNC